MLATWTIESTGTLTTAISAISSLPTNVPVVVDSFVNSISDFPKISGLEKIIKHLMF